VVVLVLDARQDISDQDAHIAAFIRESGRALVVAVNKWDGLDLTLREQIKGALESQLSFIDFRALSLRLGAQGQGLETLFRSVDAAHKAAIVNLPTPQLTRALIEAVARQAPPRSGQFRPKLRYAHQGGRNPPLIVIHGNALDKVPESYRRYLEHAFREVFKLQGTPLQIQFNVSSNPLPTGRRPSRTAASRSRSTKPRKGDQGSICLYGKYLSLADRRGRISSHPATEEPQRPG
jgi:GTP-binding protein